MKLFFAVLGFALLTACVTREVERETVVERPRPADTTVVVPADRGSTRSGETTVIVPR
jgi:hypothetical protein